MYAKDAIKIAKQYIEDVFGDEGAYNVGLEEVTYDGDSNSWEVTIGFSRPWDKAPSQNALIPLLSIPRTYKIVDISDRDGRVLSMRNRPRPSSLPEIQ